MSQFESTKNHSKRMIFIDLIRFFSMVAIAHFHFHEATFYSNSHSHSAHSLFEGPLETYSRLMAFSGFSIVFISYFLIGFIGINPKKLKKLLAISLVGSITLFTVYFDGGAGELEWDIYPFIAISSLLIFLLSKIPFGLILFSALGLLAMALPPEFWIIESLKDKIYYNALFGDYDSYGKGAWPLLPWAGLPIFSFTLGKMIRLKPQLKMKLQTMSQWEAGVWAAILSGCAFYWGSFLPVPIGADFYKFVQNQPRIDIFAHMMIVFCFVRLGFVTTINQWARSKSWLMVISNLYLNQKFFLFYILNWLWIGAFSQLEDLFYTSPLLFDLILISLFPLTEWSCFLFLKLSNRIYPLFRARLHGAA